MGQQELFYNRSYNPDKQVQEQSKRLACEILRLELKFHRELESKKQQFQKTFGFQVIEMLKQIDPLGKGFIDFENLKCFMNKNQMYLCQEEYDCLMSRCFEGKKEKIFECKDMLNILIQSEDFGGKSKFDYLEDPNLKEAINKSRKFDPGSMDVKFAWGNEDQSNDFLDPYFRQSKYLLEEKNSFIEKRSLDEIFNSERQIKNHVLHRDYKSKFEQHEYKKKILSEIQNRLDQEEKTSKEIIRQQSMNIFDRQNEIYQSKFSYETNLAQNYKQTRKNYYESIYEKDPYWSNQKFQKNPFEENKFLKIQDTFGQSRYVKEEQFVKKQENQNQIENAKLNIANVAQLYPEQIETGKKYLKSPKPSIVSQHSDFSSMEQRDRERKFYKKHPFTINRAVDLNDPLSFFFQ